MAVSVGYANQLYFSRVFKKKFGVSPSASLRIHT
ncbi:AraC family transcriptional regulator [Paenibacillus apiarius]|uniref:AraC family transcriptional regulator n=1 Tax=Paenibacillus apiarius TaxID=46240 RepID=A0ABT4DWJ8_9BACL|nr:AraC family transcriptional regulator [Paenibacillus apiarius]MCY9516886.1 AraC family transcriptional regulator [Paenibacillus apiarius]MCY9521732.1 AraC family transcriptional regulator [Paenibacillus apiarius]MCY9551587.1 AraC family transcriptional regulator [Paenibacillus apiarius]MCY9558742.1 AraC family transcriptional regulator [Paenibacillus apiarius]MCY9683944.1 AraC family transcriptional regulator [Paenibacillus apiarius]